MEGADGRDDDEASSSSSSDLYNMEIAHELDSSRPLSTSSAVPDQSAIAASPPNMDGVEKDDDSADMDISSDGISPLSPPTMSLSRAKRKLSDTTEVSRTLPVPHHSPPKGQRFLKSSITTPDGLPWTASLPADLWQRVFLHLSPPMLSRCLSVCKAFNIYLTGVTASDVAKDKINLLDSEFIWTNSRKQNFPRLPRPLTDISELKMLQLISGRSCHFCGKVSMQDSIPLVYTSGPGRDAVTIIWPFKIRSCGPCLDQRTMSDIKVLSHSTLGPLRLGAPYGFRTSHVDFVTDYVRQTRGSVPSNIRLAKIYYKADLEAVESEFENAKTFGDGAAEEWRKGLVTSGKKAMEDSSRWEKWEFEKDPSKSLVQVLKEYDLSSFPKFSQEIQSRSAEVDGVSPSTTVNGAHPLPQPVHVQPPVQSVSTPLTPQVHHQSRPSRDAAEAEEARQSRIKDIESRCLQLQPPLEPRVLRHIDAFQASCQISTPVTDEWWEHYLKPRILEKREAAELTEHWRVQQWAALQAMVTPVISDENVLKRSKESPDRAYDQAQAPLRARLAEFAHDHIKNNWGSGKMVNKFNANIFAIDVLRHVDTMYAIETQPLHSPASDLLSSLEESLQGTNANEPFLSLDNMKWVFDNKVRPLTDDFYRELFICAGCPLETLPKWFTLEGLIQHYGAKHTTAFGKGNVVVDWQSAKWPDEPPFLTDRKELLGGGRRIAYLNNRRKHKYAPYGGDLNQYLEHQAHVHDGGSVFDATYHKLLQLSDNAHEVWEALEGIKDLQQSIRVQTVIHHVIARFRKSFAQQLPLDLFTDALATNGQMRPLKNAQMLACKSCVSSQIERFTTSKSYYARISSSKLFTTLSLMNHFKTWHPFQQETEHFDWSQSLIELPESEMVAGLMHTPGMDDAKLSLISCAFPEAFSWPLPKIGLITEKSAVARLDDGLAARLLDRLGKRQKTQQKKKKASQVSTHASVREVSQEPLREPAEDEYDPRRPFFVQPKHWTPDPAQFDSDVARVEQRSGAPVSDPTVKLAPETLELLHDLKMKPEHGENQLFGNRRSRSPSVGQFVSTSVPNSSNGWEGTAPAEQPDISSILASLTGHGRSSRAALPSTASNVQHGNRPEHHYAEPPLQPRHRSPYAGMDYRYQTSSSHEHLASLNAGKFHETPYIQSSSAGSNTEFEWSGRYPATTQSHSPYNQPPLNYHHIYDNSTMSSSAVPYDSAYPETSIRYVRLPEHEAGAIEYRYERPMPRPMTYVDESGRQMRLIPIDEAPVTFQYSPHEPQQYSVPLGNAGYIPFVSGPAYPQPMYWPQAYATPQPASDAQRFQYDDDVRASLPRR